MRTSQPVARARTLVALSLALLFVVADPIGSGTAGAATSKEQALYSMISGARAAHGLPAIVLDEDLSRMAHRHSLRMARERRVFHHGCLSCRFPVGTWKALAENVGAAGSLRQVHSTMMSSLAHRVNILGVFPQVGVGVVKRGGRYWVTEIFFA